MCTPSNTCFRGPTQADIPNTSIGSVIFAQFTAELSLYCIMCHPFLSQNWPTLVDLNTHLIHALLGPPEFTFQTTSQSVQPLLQGSWSWPTDRPCYSICNNRLHLRTYLLRCGIKQSLKKIAILRGAIFAQISPFCAKSQLFLQVLPRRAIFAQICDLAEHNFSQSSQILQFARRYLRFPAKVRIFCAGLARY